MMLPTLERSQSECRFPSQLQVLSVCPKLFRLLFFCACRGNLASVNSASTIPQGQHRKMKTYRRGLALFRDAGYRQAQCRRPAIFRAGCCPRFRSGDRAERGPHGRFRQRISLARVGILFSRNPFNFDLCPFFRAGCDLMIRLYPALQFVPIVSCEDVEFSEGILQLFS